MDFLTPLVGPETGAPVYLPSLGVSAHPLRFLHFLIEEPAQAVIVTGSGILVNVPHPARFAFHKLWVSGRRPVSEQTKAVKDLRQAGELLEVLAEDRPGDLTRAWQALQPHGAARESVAREIQSLPESLRERLKSWLDPMPPA